MVSSGPRDHDKTQRRLRHHLSARFNCQPYRTAAFALSRCRYAKHSHDDPSYCRDALKTDRSDFLPLRIRQNTPYDAKSGTNYGTTDSAMKCSSWQVFKSPSWLDNIISYGPYIMEAVQAVSRCFRAYSRSQSTTSARCPLNPSLFETQESIGTYPASIPALLA